MLNYKIKKIDNFLNASDFSELSNYARNLSINEDITVYHNEIDEKNNIIESSIDKDLLIKINKNYFSKALEILKELNPEKAKLFCYSDFTIIKTKKILSSLYTMIHLINFYLVLYIYIQIIIPAQFFIATSLEEMKLKLIGK